MVSGFWVLGFLGPGSWFKAVRVCWGLGCWRVGLGCTGFGVVFVVLLLVSCFGIWLFQVSTPIGSTVVPFCGSYLGI